VGDDHRGPDLAGELLRLVPAGVAPECDACSFRCEGAGDGRADAARGAGNERDPVSQSKIHYISS
jgi:hypothetical protein